ncbi:MAG TPA: hypothetical protein VM433_07880 [Mycobacteriales bacterium]|nr:hypothetical protein [Mycobacteriales bacterium]
MTTADGTRLTADQMRDVLARLAAGQAHVVDRRQSARLGVPRWVLQRELRAGRWQRTGRQTVVTHNGPLDDATRRTVAVLEVSPQAALDGITALLHAGARTVTAPQVHVIVPRGAHPRRLRGVVVHESRRFDEAAVEVRDGARTVTPAVAAVHAVLWAKTDRQATLFGLLGVQQRLCTAEQFADAVGSVRRDRRRRLLLQLASDLVVGVRSLGELDVARALRARGLPEPDRQVLRRRPSGTQYLDVRFDAYDLTVEIDGEQHDDVEQRVKDVLRDFGLVADGDAVLRLPLVVFRLAREQVLDHLEGVLTSRGWRRAA